MSTRMYVGPNLYPFQLDGVVEAYFRTLNGGGVSFIYDCGIGKSVVGLSLASLIAEDAQAKTSHHDITLLICEKNKVGEWLEDFKTKTRLKAAVYHGTKRQQLLADLPDVLITTYDTGKIDLLKEEKIPGSRRKNRVPGPLLNALQGKQVMVIFDEMAKLAKRTSGRWKAWDYALKSLRQDAPASRVIGLTATPVERDYEDAYNQGLLLDSSKLCTRSEFEKKYVSTRDAWGKPYYDSQTIHDFAKEMAPLILRKRKTDPDVIDQFPQKVEEAMHLTMAKDQQELYDAVIEMGEVNPSLKAVIYIALRQIAGHPASIIHAAKEGTSEVAKDILERYGAEKLSKISSAKTDALIDYLKTVVKGQGEKAVVFTFFGQSVLRVLARVLREKGFKVYEHHGGMNSNEMYQAQQSFRRDPSPAVFLTSDAGAQGINLPEATYVIEYDSAVTYAKRTQRLSRIHRIDSKAPSVTCLTLILDNTIEEKILAKMSERNEMMDIMLQDEEDGAHISAQERRTMLANNRRLTRSNTHV